MPALNRLLCGLAANPALPPHLLDRLFAYVAAAGPDDEDADDLVYALSDRVDLGRAQVSAIAARGTEAIRLAYRNSLSAADVDPAVSPGAALAHLDEGRGLPGWAQLLAADPDPRIRRQLASCAGLPPDVVEALATDPDTGVVTELALWTRTVEVAPRLARHPHAEVRRAAALNEAVPPAVLAALITGEGLAPAEVCLVCDSRERPFTHHPYEPASDWWLRDGAECDGSHGSTVEEIRERAVRNPSTPPEAALTLANHPWAFLRCSLAERSDLPEEAYARLAEDPEPAVWKAVAENPAIGEPLIRALAGDPRAEVRRGLARHPRVPLDVLERLAGSTRTGRGPLPRIAAASPAELAALAGSPRAAVRTLVAQRHDLPPELRDALADDPDAAVAKSVAPHPGLSEDRLRAMVARGGVQVLAGVAANPNAPGALLVELARHDPPVREALRAIAGHPNATAEALLPALADAKAGPLAAARPELPPEVLVSLLAGADVALAEAAAGNPSLPVAAMEELLDRYAEPGATRPVS